MLQKKKGFTLVEVLVVILISGLVLSMVATSMAFITSSSGELIHQAEDIDMAKNIEKYLRNLIIDNPDINLEKLAIDTENDDFENDFIRLLDGQLIDKINEKVVFSNTGLTSLKISSEDNVFIKCKMVFDGGKEFEFTLAALQNGG